MDGLLSAEEEKVRSELVGEYGSEIQRMTLGTYRDISVDFTFVAKAYCKIHRTTTSKEKIAVGLKDRHCVSLLLQLSQCLTTLYGTSIAAEVYILFLTDILPVSLTPSRWSVQINEIIEDVEDARDIIENDTADQLIAIINDISMGGSDGFELVRKKALSSWVPYEPPPPLQEKESEVVEDAQTRILKWSIEKLFEQAGIGIDCSDEKKLVGDDLYYDNIDKLYSLVDLIFGYPIDEVETIAGILQYYPEFKPLENEMMKYIHAGIGKDCLIDGLGDGSSTYSGTHEQLFLTGEKWKTLLPASSSGFYSS